MDTIILIIQLVTIFTGLVCLRARRPVILCLTLVIVLAAAFVEQVFIPFSSQRWKLPNNVGYNLFSLIDMICWFGVYYSIFSKHRFLGRIVLYSGMLVFVYTIVELFVLQSLYVFHSRSLMCFNTCMILFSGIYIFGITRQEARNFSIDAAYWLSAAALCFNGIFFINLAGLINSSYWSNPAAVQAFALLQFIAIAIYYLFICIAFLTNCSRPRPAGNPSS
jgi:hypothetical protein